MSGLHPATEWARSQTFDSSEIDCTTAVVLKILDGKCKMLPGEKMAIMQIYDVVRRKAGVLFDEQDHATIAAARIQDEQFLAGRIHDMRVHAEAMIPKPVMKRYKARLRDGLFG